MPNDALHMHLARAEEAVLKGELQLARQRKLVGALRRDGHRTTEAITVLERFEESHAQNLLERERLRLRLAQSPPTLTSALGTL
jgi:hypothetical protein